MSEEKPSESIEFILIIFGIIVISIIAAKPLIDAISVFVYFFSKANAEAVSQQISELITVSAGTPGNVNIKFIKPSGADYNVYFRGKFVFIEIYNYKKPPGFSEEDIEKLGNKSYSSASADFEGKDIADFEMIEIEKREKIKLNTIGGLD
jgi:hypothetical protein